jgi:hypothetical protein
MLSQWRPWSGNRTLPTIARRTIVWSIVLSPWKIRKASWQSAAFFDAVQSVRMFSMLAAKQPPGRTFTVLFRRGKSHHWGFCWRRFQEPHRPGQEILTRDLGMRKVTRSSRNTKSHVVSDSCSSYRENVEVLTHRKVWSSSPPKLIMVTFGEIPTRRQ